MYGSKDTLHGHDGDEVLDGAAEPVERRDDESVTGTQVVEDLPEFFALGVLAGLLVREDPAASGIGEHADLPVEQLPLGGHACVSHKIAGSDDWNRGEEIGGVVVRRLLHPQIVQKRAMPTFLSMPTLWHRFMGMIRRQSGRVRTLADLSQ
jgi:hypothetical protein